MLFFAVKQHVYLLLCIIIIWDLVYVFSSFTGKYRLTVVTPYLGDQSYFQIRNRNSGIHTQTDAELKKRICHYIFSSPLFLMMNEEPVYLDEAFIELRLHYSEIYKDLFVRSYEESSDHKDYAVRSKSFEVFVEDSEEAARENLFTCLSRNTKRNQIYRYFISDEYDVSDEFSSSGNYIAGRFVYAEIRSDGGKTKIHLLALAEEPANVLVAPDFDVESHYIDIRREHKPAEKSSEDPICQLNVRQRRRICAQIFGAYNFEREIIFPPRIENVYKHCERKAISFHKDDARRKANGFIYEEWMIGCNVQRLLTGYKFAYWLSRAYTTNRLFVYKYDFFSGNLFIDNLSINIRLVYDDDDSSKTTSCCGSS